MRALLIQPERVPQVVDIDSSLEALQSAVGGLIQAVYPYDDPVAIVCNEEAKLIGLPLNRALRDDQNEIYDIVSGDFLIVGLGEEDFCDLTPELLEKYERLFHTPEIFVRLGERLLALPL
ncbi:MAG: DUF3846 domain-containing protein [Oscillospiraceae bacterium]|nr:DUF3846 domain-containing protein [Oscillospiraceae bacterium]